MWKQGSTRHALVEVWVQCTSEIARDVVTDVATESSGLPTRRSIWPNEERKTLGRVKARCFSGVSELPLSLDADRDPELDALLEAPMDVGQALRDSLLSWPRARPCHSRKTPFVPDEKPSRFRAGSD
jgi:hypothetical protein